MEIIDKKGNKKADRFKRIAEYRTIRILNDLRLLGNTANRNVYAYSEEQVQKIFSAIDQKLTEVRGRFKVNKNDKFEL